MNFFKSYVCIPRNVEFPVVSKLETSVKRMHDRVKTAEISGILVREETI